MVVVFRIEVETLWFNILIPQAKDIILKYYFTLYIEDNSKTHKLAFDMTVLY